VSAAAIDWSTLGKVTSIKNQGNCGSCWSFSAIANFESSIAITKNVGGPDLSEQELVDCSAAYGNQGCNGGWMTNAFTYMKVYGISKETSYPYTAVTSLCKKRTPVYKVLGIYTSAANSACPGLLSLLTNRPVSVAVDATNWGPYKSGIFNNCGLSVNHGVLAVGRSLLGEWKIKNSWGTLWGEKGYIRLAAGNTCNVCTYPSYALPV
jgi:C1A family cysteine protease